MPTHLATRQQDHFVLWRPARVQPPPRLIIGVFHDGNPPTLAQQQQFDLTQSPLSSDLWEVAAAKCGLAEGQVYHYWFEVNDDHPDRNGSRIRVTDPTAPTVDWRLLAPQLPAPYDADDRDPAGVIKHRGGRLVPCDPGGEEPDWSGDAAPDTLPTNNRLVIYEMPTSWARPSAGGGTEFGVGSFRDVLGLVDPAAGLANFGELDAVRGAISDLGINALELLPPADSWVDREWGYATSNYFAADFDLGRPAANSWPTATTDLVNLVKACHARGIRFICDVVMAFATRYSYEHVNYHDFHVRHGTGDPEEFKEDGSQRDGFGGRLFKYNYRAQGYDPVTGTNGSWVPARRLMLAFLSRWMEAFGVDGLRIDSTPNIRNWDFLLEFKDHGRALWGQRWVAAGLPEGPAADARFLAVGEELPVNHEMVRQGRLHGLWNEDFLHRVKHAILGLHFMADADFAETVQRMVDCRRVGFGDLVEAVNYITSHDVEGFQKERLGTFLRGAGVDIGRRSKLAFACLLTAVGVPMILAGDEFADEHDRERTHPAKQSDPVNYHRLVDDAWRQELFQYVSRLVGCRKTCDGLSVNETEFIHHDFTGGRRVMAWLRGRRGSAGMAVVVANFSDWGSESGTSAEYRVANWPGAPAGTQWFEVTQQRAVPQDWAGREPVFPWEAKLYVLR